MGFLSNDKMETFFDTVLMFQTSKLVDTLVVANN
jgi:hypothetical protein